MDTLAAVVCVLVYGVGNPPCASQMLSTRRTHFCSLLKKQNTKYRLGLISYQAGLQRVRIATYDGDTRQALNSALSDQYRVFF